MYLHLKDKNKDRIQDDVAGCADQYGQHAHLGKPLCVDKGIHAQRKLHKERTDDINGQILVGIAESGVAGAKPIKQCILGSKKKDGQHGREAQQCGKAVAHDPFGPGLIAFTHLNGGQWRAAHTDQRGKGRDNHNNGEGDAHTGQRQGAAAGKMAKIHAVYDIIKRIDQLSRDGRHGETEKQPADRIPAQVVLEGF